MKTVARSQREEQKHPSGTLPFSEEELAMVGYYAAEVQKILPVSTVK
jgi:hypothetical protein